VYAAMPLGEIEDDLVGELSHGQFRCVRLHAISTQIFAAALNF